jgi:hypothetical protein
MAEFGSQEQDRAASIRRANSDAITEWIERSGNWTHFCGLTFASETSPAAGMRAFRDFVARLRRLARGPVRYVVVSDWGACGARYHLHAVLSTELVPSSVARCWKAGRSDVQVFDAARGGLRYVADKVAAGRDAHGYEWDVCLGPTVPRRRARASQQSERSLALNSVPGA